MVEAKAQAAQLDSVTDVVQEQEVDANRALEAMSALSSQTNDHHSSSNNSSTNVIVLEDIQLLCQEFDISEDTAIKALRDAAMELGIVHRGDSTAIVSMALRKLITS